LRSWNVNTAVMLISARTDAPNQRTPSPFTPMKLVVTFVTIAEAIHVPIAPAEIKYGVSGREGRNYLTRSPNAGKAKVAMRVGQIHDRVIM
jgi:hypothetical protein